MIDMRKTPQHNENVSTLPNILLMTELPPPLQISVMKLTLPSRHINPTKVGFFEIPPWP
jgi:hypothetical protein